MSIYMTVYQCICMHEYIYVCTHVCIVCVYMCVHASMCRCMYVYMYACVQTCMYVCNFKVGFLSSMGGGIVLVGREIVRWGIVRGNCPGECPFPVLNSCILYGVLYIVWYCVWNSCILYGILTPSNPLWSLAQPRLKQYTNLTHIRPMFVFRTHILMT